MQKDYITNGGEMQIPRCFWVAFSPVHGIIHKERENI